MLPIISFPVRFSTTILSSTWLKNSFHLQTDGLRQCVGFLSEFVALNPIHNLYVNWEIFELYGRVKDGIRIAVCI